MTDTTDAAAGPTLADVKAEADATAAELAKHEAADAAQKQKPRRPSMGRIVIARNEHGHDCPAIIIEVREDGTVDLQLFRGDHMSHAAHALGEIEPDAKSVGWFWPPVV